MYMHRSYMLISTTVISEPDDVTVCEGRSATFTCIFQDSGIKNEGVQWYRLLKDTGTTERLHTQRGDMIDILISNENNFTTILYLLNARKSHTGYYWVRLPSDDVCNVSLTIGTSM